MALPALALGSLAGSIGIAVVAYLAEAAKSIVGRVLIAIGFGVVTSTGLTMVLNSVMQGAAVANIGNSQVIDAMSGVGMTWFISNIFAALTARLTLKGLTSDSVSFWVMRKRTPGA